MTAEPYDVVVVGGGHNGLVAATLLGRAGRRVLVLEAREVFGGAVASTAPFAGVGARLSRYSYLVSLFPAQLIEELGLDVELASRRVSSYTPVGDSGLLVEQVLGEATRRSFADLAGDAEADRWSELYARIAEVAAVVAPTLTGPLPRAAELRGRVDAALWSSLVERPISELITAALTDDTVRGVAATDALIGTFARLDDPSLRQNRCFLYHLIGNGTGEWRVPLGGMGRLAAELVRVATEAGATLHAQARVERLDPGADGVAIVLHDGQLRARHVLAGCAPNVLARLLGAESPVQPEGAQLKINLVLRRLPRLRSGIDPETAFAGTLHLGEGYRRLDEAYDDAAAGRIPDPLPCEVYCHTLTDQSILDPELREAGWHTLTLFGLHTPARLFRDDPVGARQQAERAALRCLQDALAEPLEDCLAHDANGRPCLETKSPLDVEADLAMPGGHIFHGDLQWPWLADDAPAETAAQRWGVATDRSQILLCGSGAVRGGAVSGLGGHNAAKALLDT